MDAITRLVRRMQAYRESPEGKQIAMAAAASLAAEQEKPEVRTWTPPEPQQAAAGLGVFKYTVKQAIDDVSFTRLIPTLPTPLRPQLLLLIERGTTSREAQDFFGWPLAQLECVLAYEGLHFPT